MQPSECSRGRVCPAGELPLTRGPDRLECGPLWLWSPTVARPHLPSALCPLQTQGRDWR